MFSARSQRFDWGIPAVWRHFYRATLRRARYCRARARQVVCPSVRLSVTLRYRDHIDWKSSKIISRLVTPGCSLTAHPNITDLLKMNTQNFDPNWPIPCWIERRRHSMTNCDRMVRDSAMVAMGRLKETTIAFSNGTIDDSYDLPFPQYGVPNAPLVICRILNSHVSATSNPIHFMFDSMVGFSGSADRIALFPVRSNRWRQPDAILENYSGIARIPCDSTAFLHTTSS